MASAFGKDLRRSITHSWGRFLAIAIIAALGAGFYAGLRMTGPDMRLAGDEYYDGTSLADVRVVSTIGFDEAQIDALRDVEGVSAVMPAPSAAIIAIAKKRPHEWVIERRRSFPNALAMLTTQPFQRLADGH